MNQLARCGIFIILLFQLSCREVESRTGQPSTTARLPVEVDLLIINTNPNDGFNVPGEITTGEAFVVKSPRSGKILEIQHLSDGIIRKGTVLVRLNREHLEAQLTELQLSLKSAELQIQSAEKSVAEHRRTLAQNESLFAGGLQNRNMVEKSRFELEQSVLDEQKARIDKEVVAARVTKTQAELAASDLLAPFDGFIQRRLVQADTRVSEGESLLELAPATAISVKFKVLQGEGPKLQVGDDVQVKPFSEPGNAQAVPATIRQIEPLIEGPGSIGYTAVFRHKTDFQTGSVVNVTFEIPGSESIVVPRAAVVPLPEDASKMGVWTISNRVLSLKPVSPGKKIGDQVVISAGIAPGDRILIAPPARLKADDQVIIRQQKLAYP